MLILSKVCHAYFQIFKGRNPSHPDTFIYSHYRTIKPSSILYLICSLTFIWFCHTFLCFIFLLRILWPGHGRAIHCKFLNPTENYILKFFPPLLNSLPNRFSWAKTHVLLDLFLWGGNTWVIMLSCRFHIWVARERVCKWGSIISSSATILFYFLLCFAHYTRAKEVFEILFLGETIIVIKIHSCLQFPTWYTNKKKCSFIPSVYSFLHLIWRRWANQGLIFPTFPHSNIEDSSLDFYFCLTQQKQLFWDPSEEAIDIDIDTDSIWHWNNEKYFSKQVRQCIYVYFSTQVAF